MAGGRICPCCGREISIRQIYWHLGLYRVKLAAELAAHADLSADDDTDPEDGDLGVENVDIEELGPAFNGPDPVLGDLGVNQDNLGVAQGNLGIDALHAPAEGLRQNPPVRIQDWPEPDDDVDNHEDGLEGNQPEDVLDDVPAFVELDAQLGLDPVIEPWLTNKEVRRVLNLHLRDLAEEEWFDLYSRHLTTKDHNTLLILATRLRTHFLRQIWDDLRYGVCKDLDILL
ncbi:hypothetical protein FRC10_005843 [Ceratobasidium sp. 414]|nr:hypothetical protein FRC10_005843 [Ceratobasidium sp. 414]